MEHEDLRTRRDNFWLGAAIVAAPVIILAAYIWGQSDGRADRRTRATDLQVICALNDSYTVRQDGWLPVQEADRQRLSRLAGLGRVEIEPRQGGAKCAIWRGDEPALDVSAAVWHWRPRQ